MCVSTPMSYCPECGRGIALQPGHDAFTCSKCRRVWRLQPVGSSLGYHATCPSVQGGVVFFPPHNRTPMAA
jgi:hypothetical protein